MLKPICMPCRRFFRVRKTGMFFIEGMPRGDKVRPGTAEPEKWVPYKLWVGDQWECEGCGTTILSGFGSGPIAEHYMSEFKDLVERYQATFQVNDC